MNSATPPHQIALLLVDLQNDFLHPRGAYARGGAHNPAAADLPARLLPLARALTDAGGLVVASQFTLWPNAQRQPLIDEHLQQLRPFLQAGDFAPQSWGQAIVQPLQALVVASVQKVAYSAFYATQLHWLLQRCGIRELWVAGIVTQGGVASTARDAHTRGYRVLILADGCAAFSARVHDTALADLGNLMHVGTIAEQQHRLATPTSGAPS